MSTSSLSTSKQPGAGISEKEIEQLNRDQLSTDWPTIDRLVLEAVDQLAHTNTITDEVWESLLEFLTEQQLIDLVFTIGTYNMIAWALNAFGVQLDERLGEYRWRRPRN